MHVPHICRNGCRVICSRDKTGEPCPNCGSPLISLENLQGGGTTEVFWTGPKKVAMAVLAALGTLCLVLWLFFSPPKEAQEAIARLNPERAPNPTDRIEAIQVILKLALADQKLSGWQQIQKIACKDPDAKVRVAAVRALGEFVVAKPDQVVVKGALGEATYIDTDSLSAMGKSDPSPEVRVIVADFWSKADVLWKPGIKSLEEMIATEQDPQAVISIRGALAIRVEISLKRGDLGDASAKQLQNRYKL